MPTTAKTIPQIQNNDTTRHSDQPSNSKLWCNGLILKTRLPVVLKEITWIITDNVSKTNTPPIITSSISIFVIIAIPAIAAPSDKEPVSAKVFMGDSGSLSLGAAIASISIFVIIAIPAIAAPSDKEPVSPINTLAGWALKTKNPSSAPTVANANIVTNSYSGK